METSWKRGITVRIVAMKGLKRIASLTMKVTAMSAGENRKERGLQPGFPLSRQGRLIDTRKNIMNTRK